MHEVGIALEIIKIVKKETEKADATVVKEVKIIIGEFTGIVKESLDFAFDIIKKETIAKDARFVVEIEKLKTKCCECNNMYGSKNEANFICPNCGGLLEILSGKEMKIEYIDVE